MKNRCHSKRIGRAVYHHDQSADGLDIRPGDIVVMPGGFGPTAWWVAGARETIIIAPTKSHAEKIERRLNNEP